MATKSDSPHVIALLKEVEKVSGLSVKTPYDFSRLAEQISNSYSYISESTIKRLWIPSLGYPTVSEQTLNTLSQFAGYDNFDSFKKYLSEHGIVESELVIGKECIKSDELEIGSIISIAWMPDRECILTYLGNRKFQVTEAKNSTIQPGDTFYCSTFIKGRGLYVDNLSHDGTIFDSYGMGTEHGLTRVKLLNK